MQGSAQTDLPPAPAARDGAAAGADLVVLEPPDDVGPAPPPNEGAHALASWRERMREAGALLALDGAAAALVAPLGRGGLDPERIDRLLWDERILAGAGADGAHVRDWLALAARRGGARLLAAPPGGQGAPAAPTAPARRS